LLLIGHAAGTITHPSGGRAPVHTGSLMHHREFTDRSGSQCKSEPGPTVRRPTLLGALVLKAATFVMDLREADRHVQDIGLLMEAAWSAAVSAPWTRRPQRAHDAFVMTVPRGPQRAAARSPVGPEHSSLAWALLVRRRSYGGRALSIAGRSLWCCRFRSLRRPKER
jgi:hypothetical protein